jgi:cell division protein FtsL
MKDWAAEIETRNYGIKSGINTGTMFEFMRFLLMFSLIAGAFLVFSWVRNRIISTGYESQKLFELEASLLSTQKKLILEEETLRNPELIENIARTQLNMAPLSPNQIIMTSLRNVAGGNVMAMANSETDTEKIIPIQAIGMNRNN